MNIYELFRQNEQNGEVHKVDISLFRRKSEQCDHGLHIDQWFIYMEFVQLGRQGPS